MKLIFALFLALVSLLGFSYAAKSAICSLPPQSGDEGKDCQAYSRLYYYDVGSNQCKTFEYGGCGGNGNRFDTLSLCEKTCKNA